MKLNREKKRFLLALPVIAWPFLCFTFSRLGGGTSGDSRMVVAKGINPELPTTRPDPKQVFLDKLKLYEKAEHDSARKEQYQRQDPYRKDTVQRTHGVTPLQSAGDPRADQLLEKLARLKRGLQTPPRIPADAGVVSHRGAGQVVRGVEDTGGYTRMGKLNEMLDKVIRIQHPEEVHKVAVSRQTYEVAAADPTANTISATIPADQTLTAGTTISLRITDSIKIDGRLLAGGQLVYGVVSIANDRMLVHITGLREGNRLYPIELQVYDLDGIAGIHIPGELSRDVAKQSADQGVNALNVLNADASVGAQAATAGIQTVKTFVGRKVRQVRVTVRAGYQVLLRNTQEHTDRVFSYEEKLDIELRPPGFVPGGPILSRCGTEGLELTVRNVSLERGYLWFGLELANHVAIDYTPAYMRWYIRDRRKLRRTAMQEIPLEPSYIPRLPVAAGDSTVPFWVGFKPFAFGKDKELVLEIGEKGGGRTLTLAIDHRAILHAKMVSP